MWFVMKWQWWIDRCSFTNQLQPIIWWRYVNMCDCHTVTSTQTLPPLCDRILWYIALPGNRAISVLRYSCISYNNQIRLQLSSIDSCINPQHAVTTEMRMCVTHCESANHSSVTQDSDGSPCQGILTQVKSLRWKNFWTALCRVTHNVSHATTKSNFLPAWAMNLH